MKTIDLFLDGLEGLALVDFEFDSIEEKERFLIPDLCLADVTQEESIAGGFLAGKRYADIESFLEKYGYEMITINFVNFYGKDKSSSL
jgi:hypothetical protein